MCGICRQEVMRSDSGKVLLLGRIKRNYVAICLLLLCKCTAITYLPNDEYFYDDTEIVVASGENRKTQNRIKAKTIDGVGFRSNQTFFGSRPEAWCYFIAGQPKESAFARRFIKNTLGEAPVLLSDVYPDRVAALLENKLRNEGYLTSTVTYRVKRNERKRSSRVVYNISLQRPYYLGNIRYPTIIDSIYTPVFNILSQASLLSAGQQYSLKRLQAELDRVEEGFRNSGFYFFSGNQLVFEADSSGKNHQIDLALTFNGPPPKRAGTVYKLNKPVIYFDRPWRGDTSSHYVDTISFPSLNLIYNTKKHKQVLRPNFLANIVALKEDKIFTLDSHETTRHFLMNLGLFHSISLSYTPTSPESDRLNPAIFLGSHQKKTFQSDLKLVSKSNGSLGPFVSVTFSDRNLMMGAERLDVTVSGAYETQISNKSTGTLDAFELELESSLVIRKLLLPLKPKPGGRKSLPSTIFELGANFRNRIDYYDVRAFNASIGYSWKHRDGRLHQFFPFDLSYMNTHNISDEFFDVLLLNPTLATSLQDQFIIASRYSYATEVRNTSLDKSEEDRRPSPSQVIFKGTLEQGGALLDAAISKARDDEERPYGILGSPYAQYIRGEANVRHYLTLNGHQKIVANILAAAGYAYGNAKTLPYVKQYSMGGASSIRAFPARTIGPGSYNYGQDPTRLEDTTSFTDQLGDIALQANIEYRFDIYKMFKGGLFVDAGNIWTVREDSVRPGSQFKSSEFYKQLGVGAGVGLRLALGFMLLRFDVAVPLKRQDTGWLLKSMEWNDSDWRKENIVFNIGVGYPF
jgi:outer membrane protein insertion porin family